MQFLAVYFICALTVYGVACGVAGSDSSAPLWLRWPQPIWDFIAHDWRRPPPAPKRPDYAMIDQLERELGLVGQEPERSLRQARTVCLTKDCRGETTELRSWSGMLMQRIHDCERP
ncbi:hypothetical protein QFZ63_001493 [Streptomyces sp. B3I7]|uniref:hypothetical protein n=1 Tax=Streptomyces sp. B3I7 TaxID=3042269 RepID=UPI0027868D33|nr:hypothetical protein [Streptomyces sp. B3I7]MDQ0809779.1 hypothetical protein [Streptomyces sp. B3I7]